MSGINFPSNLNLSHKKRMLSSLVNLRLELEKIFSLGEEILERNNENRENDMNNLMADLKMVKESNSESSGIEVA
jgi:hypothetical protein